MHNPESTDKKPESNDFFARNTEIEIPLSSIYICRNYLKFFVKEI